MIVNAGEIWYDPDTTYGKEYTPAQAFVVVLDACDEYIECATVILSRDLSRVLFINNKRPVSMETFELSTTERNACLLTDTNVIKLVKALVI